MSKATSEHDHRSLLSNEKLLGEDFRERMERFGLLVENANGNWDLSDRDENALRTANAILCSLMESLVAVRDGYLTPEQRARIEKAIAVARGGAA